MRRQLGIRTVLTALSILVLCSACGGAATEGGSTTTPVEVARRTPVPLDYAPAESMVAAELDLTHLRESPYISYINGWIDMARTAAQSAEGGHDLTPLLTAWRETDGLMIAFGGAPGGGQQPGAEPFDEDTSQFVAVLHGRYTEGQLETWMRDLTSDSSELREASVDGHFVLRSTEENIFLAVMDPHTLMVGVHVDLDAALAIAAGGEPPHGTIDQLRATMDQAGAGQHTLDLAVVATPDLRETFREHGEESNDAMMTAMLETLQSLTGHASFDQGVTISLRVNTTNRLSAVAIAQELNNRLDAAASQPGLAMIGLADAVRNTRARVDGTACVVELHLDDGSTRSLLDRLQGIFQLLAQMANQHQDPQAPEAAPDTDSQQSPLRSGEADPTPGQI